MVLRARASARFAHDDDDEDEEEEEEEEEDDVVWGSDPKAVARCAVSAIGGPFFRDDLVGRTMDDDDDSVDDTVGGGGGSSSGEGEGVAERGGPCADSAALEGCVTGDARLSSWLTRAARMASLMRRWVPPAAAGCSTNGGGRRDEDDDDDDDDDDKAAVALLVRREEEGIGEEEETRPDACIHVD